MAFGKKKKGGEAEAAAPKGKAAKAQGKAKKPAELLSSVVKESVVDSAVSVMAENSAFLLPNGVPVILALEAASIGGLSEKHKNDPAKGSIVELIRSDAIAAVATEEMLQYETLGIIPNEGTLERMGEFSLLTGAPYGWATFQVDPDTGKAKATPIQKATYQEAVDVLEGRTSLKALLPDLWAWGAAEAGEAVDEPEQDLDPVEDEPEAEAPIGEIDPDAELGDDLVIEDEDGEGVEHDLEPVAADDGSGEAGFGFQGFDEEPQAEHAPEGVDEPRHAAEEPVYDDAQDEPVEPEASGEPDAYSEYVEQHAGSEFTEADVRDTIARRFLSGDLDLSIDLEPFDKVFDVHASQVAFTYNEEGGWLSEQVALMARQANAELGRLRADNKDELRQLYVRMGQRNIEQVVLAVDPERKGSDFNELLEAAQQDFEDAQAAADQERIEARRRVNEEFDKEAEIKGEQARAEAVARYRERHRATLARRLDEVAADVDARSEAVLSAAHRTIYDMRRRTAQTRVEMGETRIFEILMERHEAQVAAEQQLMKDWSDALSKFIDDNRKADIARVDALGEKLSREDDVARLTELHENEKLSLKRDHEARVTELDHELSRLRAEHLAEAERQRSDWEASLALERERATLANEQTKAANDQVEVVRESTEAAYQVKVANLETEKDRLEAEMERSVKQGKRTTYSIIAVAIVGIIAGALAGVVGGYAWSNGNFADAFGGLAKGDAVVQVVDQADSE